MQVGLNSVNRRVGFGNGYTQEPKLFRGSIDQARAIAGFNKGGIFLTLASRGAKLDPTKESQDLGAIFTDMASDTKTTMAISAALYNSVERLYGENQ